MYVYEKEAYEAPSRDDTLAENISFPANEIKQGAYTMLQQCVFALVLCVVLTQLPLLVAYVHENHVFSFVFCYSVGTFFLA